MKSWTQTWGFSGTWRTFWRGDKRLAHKAHSPPRKRVLMALHMKFLATRLNGGEQMLPEMSAWLQMEKNSSGASARGASLLLYFSWACCSCNSQHHASDITADAARRRRCCHANPSSSGANGNVWFPINQGCGHQNSSSDLCKYQRADLKQKLAKNIAKVFSFSFKDDFMSSAKKQNAYRTNKVKNWVETVKLEVR